MLGHESGIQLRAEGRDAAPLQPTDGHQTIEIADLDEVLLYENENVVDRFIVDQQVTPQEAAELFEDTKRWLWLCAEAHREKQLGGDVPDMIIFETQTNLDEMWHTFLLFTRDYVEFCHRYFGFFIHHAPTPEREKREYNEASPQQQKVGRQRKASRRRDNAAYVFDKLGEEVARRWFLPSQARAHAGAKGVEPETFHHAYRDNAPWEIGVPQPRLVEIVERGDITGDVLDVGCGTGENAFVIAAAGHRVHGVDLVPRAIELATKKAERWAVSGATFAVADARYLDLGRRYQTIVDSGVIHAFSNRDRTAYVSSLAEHLEPGGLLHVVCFSDAQDGIGPRRISEAELREIFGGAQWTIRSVEACSYEVQSGLKPAWHATIERTSFGVLE